MRILRRFFLIPFLVCCLSPLHASSARQEVTGRQETSARQEVLTGQETSVRQESSARQDIGARLLVVDYAMAYPEEHARMIRAFSEAGFDVDYRPYYPAMVERDARDYDAIVLLGGGDPGMSIQEVDLAINFVSRGKVLVLAMPSDGPYGERRKVNPGVHDRYQFNEVLARLDINLHALNADHETGPVLNPVVDFELAAGHPVGQGLDGSVAARAGTRLLVGDAAEPLLVEPEGPPPEEEPEPAPEPEYRVVRRTLRIPPDGAVPGEEVELLLRGERELRPSLYYRNREQPVPVDWTTARFRGRVEVVSDAKDTLTVRMSGNRWGSEYALVGVPVEVIAAAFADREIREEIRSASDLASMRDDEETFGRLAVAAAGRTGRLNEGFVLAVDRQVLSGLDRALPPLGIPTVEAGREGLEDFLGGFARYVRALVDAPRDWSPDHGYATAQMPGNRKPDISLNNVSVGAVLPERVRVVRSAEAGRGDSGERGLWAPTQARPRTPPRTPARLPVRSLTEPRPSAERMPFRVEASGISSQGAMSTWAISPACSPALGWISSGPWRRPPATPGEPWRRATCALNRGRCPSSTAWGARRRPGTPASARRAKARSPATTKPPGTPGGTRSACPPGWTWPT